MLVKYSSFQIPYDCIFDRALEHNIKGSSNQIVFDNSPFHRNIMVPISECIMGKWLLLVTDCYQSSNLTIHHAFRCVG